MEIDLKDFIVLEKQVEWELWFIKMVGLSQKFMIE